MAVRNFWIEVEVDGRRTKLCGGPANKQGGMTIRLYQRDNGAITQPVTINCQALTDMTTGETTLGTFVWNNGDLADSWGYERPLQIITKR